MELGKVQGSNVTTISPHSPPRGRSSRPHLMLGAWLDKVPEKELGQLLGQVSKTTKIIPPPTTHSASILMKAPKGVNNTGPNMWWEEVELWVTGKEREPYLLLPQGGENCVLVQSVN